MTVAVDGAATMTGTFRAILVTDGITGLYRGLVANFLKVAPAVSISYIVYEKTRGLLGVEMTWCCQRLGKIVYENLLSLLLTVILLAWSYAGRWCIGVFFAQLITCCASFHAVLSRVVSDTNIHTRRIFTPSAVSLPYFCVICIVLQCKAQEASG